MKPNLKTQLVPISTLREDPANVRRHSERNLDAIKASLKAFGQQKPIVVDAEGVVVAGNGTLAAAKALGWKQIAVVRTGLKGAKARAFAIADNRTAELAEWDEAALAQTLAELQQDDDFEASLVGFDAKEIEDLMESAIAEVGEFGDPEADTDPKLKESYGVFVECGGEADQQKVFDLVRAKGYRCRILTM